MKLIFPVVLAILTLLGSLPLSSAERERPRLAVILVIDQLPMQRAIELANWQGSEGFKKLFADGIVFDNAYYEYANTSTAPGHATISTGVLPSEHGVIANYWLDHETGKQTTSAADSKTQLIGIGERVVRGSSPHWLISETLADTLLRKVNGSKVYGVSMKDRGAIFTAGKNGKAFWYGTPIGKFITSDYYYTNDTVPDWLETFNTTLFDQTPEDWGLLLNEKNYKEIDKDAPYYERPPANMGKAFPHMYSEKGTRDFFTEIGTSPEGDRITINLAQTIIDNERLGQDEKPDLLTISLSVTDRIGHSFGPDSLEAEDNLFRLDRLVGEFISDLENQFGKENFILALTADHGIHPVPESIGIPAEQSRIYPNQMTRDINQYLRIHDDISIDVIKGIVGQNVYLDNELIQKNDLDKELILNMSLDWFEQLPTIARALTWSMLEKCNNDLMCNYVKANSNTIHSGDIYLVQQEGAIFSMEPPKYSTNHGSPYKADRHVPIIFYGMGLPAKHSKRQVSPSQIAATLSDILGLEPVPGMASPLYEVID